jgi:hypothetical protein
VFSDFRRILAASFCDMPFFMSTYAASLSVMVQISNP